MLHNAREAPCLVIVLGCAGVYTVLWRHYLAQVSRSLAAPASLTCPARCTSPAMLLPLALEAVLITYTEAAVNSDYYLYV